VSLLFLASLGCAKNAVDSADARRALLAAGWDETDTPALADMILVNTCGFITPAKQESIDTVLRLAECKKPGARLVMAGCFVQRNAADLAEALPEVDAFFGINFAEMLAAQPDFSGIAPISWATKAEPYSPRLGTSFDAGPGAAWLKISDGCDNCCSYCAIPLIRGPFRARASRDILREAKDLAQAGIQEINIISQDTSRYADPEDAAFTLIRLLDALEEIDGPRWIRLLYLHPATTSPELVTRMLAGGKVVPYFDLPAQALVDSSLQRMQRRVTYADILRLVDSIRSRNEAATIRSTLITGYPGETARDHALTIQRMHEISLDKLGAFAWSPEEGTPAARERPRVRPATAEQRLDEIMRTQQEISASRLTRYIGKTLPVLICGSTATKDVPPSGIKTGDAAVWGRSPADAPDVDGLVCASVLPEKKLPKSGSFADIRISVSSEYDLYGELA
jgi:ribosomal protein S12 methylthiotransferase